MTPPTLLRPIRRAALTMLPRPVAGLLREKRRAFLNRRSPEEVLGRIYQKPGLQEERVGRQGVGFGTEPRCKSISIHAGPGIYAKALGAIAAMEIVEDIEDPRDLFAAFVVTARNHSTSSKIAHFTSRKFKSASCNQINGETPFQHVTLHAAGGGANA